ncbi:GTP-binding protein YPT32/YPT11 [Astathelohania contejeani]|uniref:GTP-binding protein YPT32/YPT11 n=1 Tax=Astathelohania contejeani TaxID=164912 RepID=A0ABQ7HX77_9MICR|nr:GTP-binding protein YPT32/YPT11 [Thelohania contejeani]
MAITQDQAELYDYLFKIVLIGNSGVGKTNLLSKLTRNDFQRETKATIGVEFATMTFKLKEAIVKAQIWDTAGQERYRAITSAYYRGTLGALIVYDVTRKSSLTDSINHWLTQLRAHSQENITIMLVGNKVDLEEMRQVTQGEGERLACANGLIFFETSAYSGENVKEAFNELIKCIYEKNKTLDKARWKKVQHQMKLEGVPLETKKKKSGCC